MTWERVWDVLKWVLIALAAGFVGQFGRSLSLWIIRRRKRDQARATGVSARGSVSPEVKIERTRLDAMAKVEKKKAKAAVKKRKKDATNDESD